MEWVSYASKSSSSLSLTVDWMLDLVLALEGGGLVGWWTPGVSASVGPETGIKSLQS